MAFEFGPAASQGPYEAATRGELNPAERSFCGGGPLGEVAEDGYPVGSGRKGIGRHGVHRFRGRGGDAGDAGRGTGEVGEGTELAAQNRDGP